MKQNRFLLIVLALGLSGSALSAQTGDDQPPPGRPGEGQPPPPRNWRGPERQRPPQPPIISALDLNHDGVIDADEISKASDSLKKLDKNGDGNLAPDELRPEGAFGQGGPGFRGPACYPGD